MCRPHYSCANAFYVFARAAAARKPAGAEHALNLGMAEPAALFIKRAHDAETRIAAREVVYPPAARGFAAEEEKHRHIYRGEKKLHGL